MSEFSQLKERAELDNLMNYLIYGCTADPVNKAPVKKDVYQKRIDEAYDQLFDELKSMFPSAARDRDDLYNAVLQFSMTHQEVYTEMGFITGCRFCSQMHEACRNLGEERLCSIVEKLVSKKEDNK